MGHGHRKEKMRGPDAYSMCKRKLKLKSSQASKMANRFKQRKYHCPICGHWHLTKMRDYHEKPQVK